MSSPLRSRRAFLQDLALGIAVAPWITRDLFAQAPAGRIRHACFGCAGMGWTDVTAIAKHELVDVVAGCDVDEKKTAEFRKKFPEARIYSDYRELLEKEKDLHTVNVSTPDHMHASIGMASLQRGLHVYGQKPLTHNLYECRQLTKMAREKKRVTQMGIQLHSGFEYRTAVKLIQSGVIGKIKEVQIWSNKKWGDSEPMPEKTEAPPEGLDWDKWLGVAAERPYIGGEWYHPANWRKRVDFGTGTLGDMACHIFDPVFSSLGLTNPISVRSEGPKPSEHSWSKDAVVHYVFPGTKYTAGKTINVSWHDGDKYPAQAILDLAFPADEAKPDDKFPDQASIFLGTKGIIVLPHIGMPRLVGKAVKDLPITKVEGINHWHEFIDAAVGKGKKPGANFDYAGPLSEAVLLGSVAVRFPQTTLNWNAPGLKFTNVKEANDFVRRTYRKGWEVAGLA